MDKLQEIIRKSNLDFLKDINFAEITPGRFFQKEKIDLGGGLRQFIVVLAPGVESPVHNHAGQNMEETHMLLWGSGKFLIYENGVVKELILEKGKFHKIFTTPSYAPDHKYVAGPEGSITIALEKHY